MGLCECVETGVYVQRWVCVCVFINRDGCIVVNDGEVWRQRWVYVYVCVFLWIEDEWWGGEKDGGIRG